MTTYRADGTAIRLPGVMKRIEWLIGYELAKWIKRHQGRYEWCELCGVARLKAAHKAYLHIHDEGAHPL